MKKKVVLIIVIVLIAGLFAGIAYKLLAIENAKSAIVYPEGTISFQGHRYYFIDGYDQYSGGAWQYDDAQEKALAMGGHLAIINDAEENDFLYKYMRSKGILWAYIGYSDSVRGREQGEWKWVDNPRGITSTYTNWGGSEPNNGSEIGEDFAQIDSSIGGKWIDNDSWWDGKSPKYYICEWEPEEETKGWIPWEGIFR